jgi:hypothetical protein
MGREKKTLRPTLTRTEEAGKGVSSSSWTTGTEAETEQLPQTRTVEISEVLEMRS